MAITMSRKQFLYGAAAATSMAAMGGAPARAKQRYVIRLGSDTPLDHPITKGIRAAAKDVKSQTSGAVEILVFPNNQLGDDTHMVSDLRAGGIQMMAIGDNILATLVSSAAIDNVGFAFTDAKMAWAALDGTVGELVRADIEKAGLQPMPRVWDLGFREITTSTKPIHTPADLKGFKMRVPPSPISLSLFRDLGAAPTTLNGAELYTALQTKVVDGQENPLGVIETLKFYEVQKYCSLTNHMWVGYWMLMNGTFWKRLPADYQKIIAAAFDAQALTERVATEQLNNSLQSKLEKQGLTFNKPNQAPFRDTLVKSGFYKEWQGKFGPTLWAALEKYTGKLA